MRQRHPLLLTSLVALFAGFGGVILPIQAPAIGGICGGATPCGCGDTLVDSRTLVNGVDPVTVTVCPGDGLVVDGLTTDPAANMTLDLGGNTIRGSLNAGTAGIRVGFYDGFTLMSGRVTGFESGVFVEETGVSRFTGLQLPGNGRYGVLLTESNNNMIDRNVISRMECGAAGILVSGGNNLVTLNQVVFNELDGTAPGAITVNGGGFGEPGANILSRNIIRENRMCETAPVAGLALTDNGARVEQNRSEDNDGDGFVIECIDPLELGMTVKGNIALRNGPHLGANGFTVARCGSRFAANRSDRNGGYGFLEEPSAGPANTYVTNRCTGNGLGKSSPAGLCR